MKNLILNFHGVGITPRNTPKHEIKYWLERNYFDWILDQVSGKKNIILTFDDGNDSDYTEALPALASRGLIGKFFICSERIDSPGFLSRKQIQTMANKGMQFGTHGTTHHSWRYLPAVQLSYEIRESCRSIKDITNHEVNEAAYPYGDYGSSSLHTLRKMGIKTVFTSDGAWWDGLSWIVPRFTISNRSTRESLQKILSTPESIFKSSVYRIKQLGKRIR